MSDRYGDIQTQNDLDLHLREADCCGVPLCPVPTMEIECKSASLSGSYLWPYQITGGLAADELIPRLYDTEATTFPAETVGGTMTRTTNTQSTDTTGSKYQQIVGLLPLITTWATWWKECGNTGRDRHRARQRHWAYLISGASPARSGWHSQR